MSVKLHLSKFFSLFVENRDWVEVDGSNLGECLDELVNLFPNLKESLFSNTDTLQPYIEIVVNRETNVTTDMAKQIQPGNDIYIYAIPRCC
jgi:hypothetical protein